MIDESAAVLPLWMLISATFGFIIGEALGGQARLRKYLEQANEQLRDDLAKAHECRETLRQLLKQQRGAINDTRDSLPPVPKAPQNPPSKPHKTNNRISMIRLCHNLYLMVQDDLEMQDC